MAYRYLHSCIESDYESIRALLETATDISYRTALKHCDGLIEWALSKGYDRRSDQGLTLRDDWHVNYLKGTYRGVPCYVVQWSGIEHIWAKEG